MFQKDLRRAERRSRSFNVWMRRLKGDWNDHGWKRDPLRSSYDPKYFPDGTTLCACFNLRTREALRFKDTPTGNQSDAAYRKSDGYYDRRLWEERNIQPDEVRESGPYRKRRHREGTHPYRVCCRICGFLISIAQVENGSWYRYSNIPRCGGCEEKAKKKHPKGMDIMKMPA